jgi:hypothetical protein
VISWNSPKRNSFFSFGRNNTFLTMAGAIEKFCGIYTSHGKNHKIAKCALF